jgi:hypothetical protein
MSRRVSLILGDGDEVSVAPFLTAGTEQHAALAAWAARQGQKGPMNSEASALRALLAVAVEALRDDALDAGYAQLATAYHAESARTERRAARDRYAARVDAGA